jgi:fengycin family lipopeptide synthetase D
MAAPEESLFFRMKYNGAKYSEGFIKRLEGQWKKLLGEIVKSTQTAITDYEILTQEEKTYLLETLNDTAVDYPKEKTIVDLFEEQVSKTPDNIAIKFKETELSYRELNERSNQLAHYLITDYSIQPDDLIGIELERSEWMVIGILAIIKSGGAYVPIDSEYPEQRKDYIVKNSGCKFVLNDAVIQSFQKEKHQNFFKIEVKNNGLLCCIYTSGSTGLPKGVMISHKNLVNRMYWMWTQYPFQADEITVIKTTIGFVDHLWELFGSLLSGTKSVIVSNDDLKEIEQFANIVASEKITRMVLVPSLLKFILTQDELRGKFSSVKLWTASGEVLPVDLVALFYESFGTAMLLNIYGSTEITADVTCFDTSTMIIEEENTVHELFKAINEEDKYALGLMDDIFLNPVHNRNFDASSIYAKEDSDNDFLSDYLDEIDNVVKKNIINVNSKYFIGHMTGPIPPFLYHVHQKMVQMNQNQVKVETSGIGTSLEQKVVAFFHKEIFEASEGFYTQYETNKDTSLGLITSGGTLSNITALQLALSKALNQRLLPYGKTLQEIGLPEALKTAGFEGAVILASSLHHYSIQKATKLMGLGTNAVIPFLSSDRVHLNRIISELKNENKLIIALVGIAGTTESGEVDPLENLSEVCKQHAIHYHVDAAFGGAFILSSHRHKLKGIQEADSVTICGHKQLYTPVGCSLVLFKSPDLVLFSEHNARYQARKGSADLGKFTNEGTRPFTALTLDAVRKLHLKGAYWEVLDNLLDKANWMYRFLRQFDGVELYAPPTMNILLYRFIPKEYISKHKSNLLTEEEQVAINQMNDELQQEQFKEGKFFVSQTRLKLKGEPEKVWLRVVLMNPFTSKTDIQQVVVDQIQKLDFSQRPQQSTYSLSVPIGKAIDNTKVLILDSRKKLQPLGAVGEICIVGDAVAMGYLKTQGENLGYIKNPFDASQKMYCTGDMGRYLQDGNILYEGRRDYQIKILGNRVNTSELRKVALEVKGVRDVFVLNHQEQLIVFIEGTEKAKDTLLQKLKSELPKFMQPAKVLFMEQFILNANGKLDKRSMIEWMNQQQTSDSDVFEGTWLDGQLQKIWSIVLKKDQKEIPFNKDFFELGGDSLKLMSLTAQINKAFDKQFRFRDLLGASTIQELRVLINKGNATSELVFYRLNAPVPNKKPLLLLPPSNGEGLVYKKLAKLLDQQVELWTVDYQKGDKINKVDIPTYAQELAMIWKQEQGSRKFIIGGYSLGFRVAYHMALKVEHQVERMINIDGMLYKNEAEEQQINQAIIATEKPEPTSEKNQVQRIKKQIDLNLEKWFMNDYFINPLKLEIQHFIGAESPVMTYVPEYASSKNTLIPIQGNHENVLEIDGNLLVIKNNIVII